MWVEAYATRPKRLMIVKTIISHYQLSNGWSNGPKKLVIADDSLPWAHSVRHLPSVNIANKTSQGWIFRGERKQLPASFSFSYWKKQLKINLESAGGENSWPKNYHQPSRRIWTRSKWTIVDDSEWQLVVKWARALWLLCAVWPELYGWLLQNINEWRKYLRYFVPSIALTTLKLKPLNEL